MMNCLRSVLWFGLATVLLLTALPLPAQSAQELVVVTNRMMLKAKRELIRKSANEAGFAVTIVEASLSDEALVDAINKRDVVLVDMSRPMDIESFNQRMSEAQLEPGHILFKTSGSQFTFSGMDERSGQRLADYYRNGGRRNFQAFFRGLQSVVTKGEVGELPALMMMPDQGAYHPDYEEQFSADPDDILRALGHRPGQPVIALGFHNRYLKADALSHINQLVEKIQAHGAFALPVFYSLGPDARLVELLKGRANVLIHMQPVYHNGFEAQLNQLGIPVLQGVGRWNDTKEGWEQDPIGLSLAATPLYLALPEQNGLIDPLVMWAERNGELSLIDYQAEAAINKAINIARLQLKAVADQKLAVMVYNYPPGEKNLSASFMNVPRSLAGLSGKWLAAGYTTRELSEQDLIDGLGAAIKAAGQAGSQDSRWREASENTDDHASISLRDYQAWFSQLPQTVQARINDYWGKPEDSPILASVDGEPGFFVHYIKAGNIVYLGQPGRGRPGMDKERQLYHDVRVPVNHYYLATYLWLRNNFKADALIHFGTHGTQEWMPGKERGLSIYDDPLLTLGDIPVIYPYIIDNVGEATQAKRRGRAVMISHQTPPFRPSGLHGVLVDIHQLIHQWKNLEPGDVKDNTVNSLLSMAQDNELTVDLNWTIAEVKEQPAEFIQRLHDYLHELADASQPIGLHTYAGDDQYQQKLTTVLQMLGEPFIAAFDLAQPNELYAGDYRDLANTAPYQWLDSVLGKDTKVEPELADWQAQAQQYYDNLDTAPEWASLGAAVRGEHIAPGIGGDPVRVPDSLPSGKNLVGFDPARVPTKEAWIVGKKAIDELIAKHREEHGEWPQRLAFSLWAVEAMRHGGILESQAFYAMGVEPVWDRAGRVEGYRVIPKDELGRPRVDVVLSVTGLYRDQFPNVMEHLARAAAEISQLNEEGNPLYEHTQMLLADLMARNIPEAEAMPMAQTRVFGSPTGVYGTGLENASLASDTWESDAKLAKLYLDRMSHAFGPDSSRWSKAADYSELYAQNLKTVDAALLARTSNLYGMLTTDDPFQYLGGIDLAVRHLTGKSPELYISNQRQAGKVRFQGADEFLAVELATRTFHPGWIESMKEEGFAGALSLQDMTNNLWGWQVVSPDVVEDHQWQKMHEIYVMDSLDLDMKEWFEQYSAEARLRIMERLLDAIRKNYWDASEQTRRELVEQYEQALAEHNLKSAHEKLAEFADDLAAGFGLATVAVNSLNAAASQAAAPQQAQTQDVQGQKLEKSSQNTVDNTLQWWWLILVIFPLFIGAWRQYQISRRI